MHEWKFINISELNLEKINKIQSVFYVSKCKFIFVQYKQRIHLVNDKVNKLNELIKLSK